MELSLVPGTFVRHPGCPDWGLGQVQSVVGSRATVNFEHRGKVTLDLRHIVLEIVPARGGPARP